MAVYSLLSFLPVLSSLLFMTACQANEYCFVKQPLVELKVAEFSPQHFHAVHIFLYHVQISALWHGVPNLVLLYRLWYLFY